MYSKAHSIDSEWLCASVHRSWSLRVARYMLHVARYMSHVACSSTLRERGLRCCGATGCGRSCRGRASCSARCLRCRAAAPTRRGADFECTSHVVCCTWHAVHGARCTLRVEWTRLRGGDALDRDGGRHDGHTRPRVRHPQLHDARRGAAPDGPREAEARARHRRRVGTHLGAALPLRGSRSLQLSHLGGVAHC